MAVDSIRDASAQHSPFVGRTYELAELRRALGEVQGGRTRFVLIAGDPGIGKTRLACEVAEHAVHEGGRVFWGRCWEGGGAPAYWPWVQVLRTCSAADTLDSAVAADAAELEARLAPGVRHRAGPTSQPEPSRFDLFDETTRWVRRVAADGVTLIVLDDLHDADEPSLQLLLFMARELRDAAVLVIGTYREAEARQLPALSRHLAALSRESRVLPLSGLSDAEVGQFVAAQVEAPPPETLVDELCRVTEGNPFFLDEIVRLWRAGKGRTVSDRLPIPEQVRDAIRHRLEPLGEGTRSVLRIAAVLGREFDERVVERLSAPDVPPSVYRCLTDAVAAGVINEMPGHLGKYRFSHALVVDTLYADLSSSQRATMHRDAAAALERLYAATLDAHAAEIAEHHLRAGRGGDARSAIAYAIRAGRRAMRVLAYEDAAQWFERAEGVLSEISNVLAEHAEIWFDIGDAHRNAGNFGHAGPAFQRAATIAREYQLKDCFVRAVLGVGGVAAETGVVNAGLVAMLEEALAWTPEGDSPVRVRLLGRLALALYFSPGDPRREPASREAVAMARRLGDPRVLIVALRTCHYALWEPGGAEERLILATEMRRIGERLADLEEQYSGLNWAIIDELELGQAQAAREDIAAYARLVAEHHAPREQWTVTLLRATLAIYQGDLRSGDYLANTALAIGERWEVANSTQFFSVQTFMLFRELGRLDEIEAGVRTFVDRYPGLPVWRCGLALLYAELGKKEAAQRELALLAAHDFADLPRDGNWIAALCLLSEVAAAVGDVARAHVLLDLLLPYTAYSAGLGTGAACAGSVTYYVGLLYSTIDQVEAAAHWLAAAVQAHTEVGAVPWIIRTHVAEAQLALRCGGSVDAVLASLHAVLDGLDLPRLQAQVDAIQNERRRAPAAISGGVRLERSGDYWSVRGGNAPFLLQDTKGLRYIAYLLQRPGEDVAASALQRIGEGMSGEDGATDLQAERDELRGLQAELAEAEVFHDLGRLEQARAAMSELARRVAEQSEAAAPATEKARLNVTRAILAALRRIRANDDNLGRYLATSIRTGNVCRFEARRL